MNTSQIFTTFGMAVGLALTAVMMVAAVATVVAPFIPHRDRIKPHAADSAQFPRIHLATSASTSNPLVSNYMSQSASSTSGAAQRPMTEQSKARLEADLARARALHPSSRQASPAPTSSATVTELFPERRPPSGPPVPPDQQVA